MEEESCCKKCGKPTRDDESSISMASNGVTCSSSIVKCRSWLESCSLSDGTSEFSSDLAESDQPDGDENLSVDVGNADCDLITANYQRFDGSLLQESGINIDQINVQKSRHVHVGNITYISGPVHVTQNTTSLQQQNVVNKIFLEGTATTQKSTQLQMIPRRNWLAQPALSVTRLPATPTFVIICHTATEEGSTQAENTLLVRLCQTFHIESKKWDDISYNFLIGGDGNVYEGRGWGVSGAHTHGYNGRSMGISFVGTYIDHLPSAAALIACQKLLELGVRSGHLPQDYSLVGHCQCLATESPGRHLYEHIRTWPRWRELTPQDAVS